MATLEILTEVEAGRMSATEALELIEPLTPGARYKCGEYAGTFVKTEGNIAYFNMDHKPLDLIYDTNGYVGFRLGFAKTFKKL